MSSNSSGVTGDTQLVGPAVVERKLTKRHWVVVGAVGALLAAGWGLAPSGEYEMKPGATIPLAAAVYPYEVDGVSLLTVRLSEPNRFESLWKAFTGSGEFMPAPAEGESAILVSEALASERAAQQTAFNAAVRALTGSTSMFVTTATVGSVEEGSRLVAVDGVPFTGGAAGPGAWLLVSPDGILQVQHVEESVDTVERPVRVVEEPGVPLSAGPDALAGDVFVVDKVGGSSGGLSYALSFYDLVSKDDLVGGVKVAATGAVDASGAVSSVEGVALKVAGAVESGAELILVPEGAEYGDVPEGVVVVEVDSVDAAVDAVMHADDLLGR